MRLVVVDDHPLFVRGLELLLPITTNGRAEVVASTGDAAAAAALVSNHCPDLALVDLTCRRPAASGRWPRSGGPPHGYPLTSRPTCERD
ncbi:hypothetical protein ACWD8I_32225, partial [Micromonospora arida]